MKRLLAVLVAAILHLSLYPWRFVSRPYFGGLQAPYLRTPGDWLDAIVNVLVYIPIGMVGVLAFARRPLVAAVAVSCAGFLLSLGIETLQFYIPGRNSNLRDLITNAVGGAMGAGLGWVVIRSGLNRRLSKLGQHGGRARVYPLLVAGSYLVWLLFPFVPTLRRVKWYAAMDALRHPHWRPVEAGDMMFAFLLVWIAVDSVIERQAWRWAATAGLWMAIPAQGLVIEQDLSVSRLLGGMLGLMAGLLLLWRPGRRQMLALGCAMLGWLALREGAPFAMQEQPAAFSWIPFAGIMSMDWASYARVLSGKLILYSGTMWALEHGGMRVSVATLLVAGLLAVGEWVQRYLPGRTPESTDVAIALLGALALAAEHGASLATQRGHE